MQASTGAEAIRTLGVAISTIPGEKTEVSAQMLPMLALMLSLLADLSSSQFL